MLGKHDDAAVLIYTEDQTVLELETIKIGGRRHLNRRKHGFEVAIRFLDLPLEREVHEGVYGLIERDVLGSCMSLSCAMLPNIA